MLTPLLDESSEGFESLLDGSAHHRAMASGSRTRMLKRKVGFDDVKINNDCEAESFMSTLGSREEDCGPESERKLLTLFF